MTRCPLLAQAIVIGLGLALSGCVQIGPAGGGTAIPAASPPGGRPVGTPIAHGPTAANGAPTAPANAPTAPGGATSLPGPGPVFVAYVLDGNIWAISPDGTGATQLTTDGAAGPYTHPAVAPDGTVYALRNENAVYHFDVAGRLLAAPANLAVLENGGEGLAVSPDGAHIAYVTTGWGTLIDARWGTYAGQYIYGGTDVAAPDGTSVPGAAMGQMLYPSWASPSAIVVSDGTTVYVSNVPSSEPTPWLGVANGCVIPEVCEPGQEASANFSEAVVNRQTTVLAYSYKPFFGSAGRRMLSLAGPPPADATLRCLIEGQQNFSDPGAFSSDGTLFVFDDTVFDPDSLETRTGQGIYAMRVDLDAPDCGASSARIIVPGGIQPDIS